MAFSTGLELGNNELAFAEHQNVELMAARGNQVIDGVGVTAQGTPDLTVAVASGNVLAGGVVVAVSADATFAGTPNTFSTTHGNLTSGQAQFVFIHVDSSGVITNTEGTAAAAGQQLPPDVPEDEVVLAQITLTEGDPTIDTVDIEDWKINVPKGGYFAGDIESTDSDLTFLFGRSRLASPDADIAFFSHRDMSTNVNYALSQTSLGVTQLNAATTKTLILSINDVAQVNITTAGVKNPVDNAGFFTGIGGDMRMFHDGTVTNYVRNVGSLVVDIDSDNNSVIETFSIVKNRAGTPITMFSISEAGTLTVGASADLIATTFNGTITISTTGAHININETDGPVDEKLWTVDGNAGHFRIFGKNDAGSVFPAVLDANRVGGTIDRITYGNSTDNPDHDFFGKITNPVDNQGFHTGIDDDLRMYHDATNSIIENSTGSLIINNTTRNTEFNTDIFILDLTNEFRIRDPDDSLATLFLLNTSAGSRSLTIGAVVDTVPVTIHGALVATSYGGITESDLLDKSTTEVISGGYTFNATTIMSRINYPDDQATGSTIVRNTSDGNLWVTSSSRRFKKDIKPIELDSSILYKLIPKEFVFKGRNDWSFGLIAEEVTELNPKLGLYDAKGRVADYENRRMQTVIIKEIQNINERLIRLENN